MLLILLILLIVLVFTGPWYPYSRSWGYGPSGGLLLIMLVLLLLYMFGGFR